MTLMLALISLMNLKGTLMKPLGALVHPLGCTTAMIHVIIATPMIVTPRSSRRENMSDDAILPDDTWKTEGDTP